MNEIKEVRRRLEKVDRNLVALALSIIPGAGHLYKHHYAAGLGILIGGNLLVVFASILLSLATAGLSLVLIPLLYWPGVAASAYYLPDWHGKHHWLHPWR